MAMLLVSAGTAVHASGGEDRLPSHVYSVGIAAPLANAAEVTLSCRSWRPLADPATRQESAKAAPRSARCMRSSFSGENASAASADKPACRRGTILPSQRSWEASVDDAPQKEGRAFGAPGI